VFGARPSAVATLVDRATRYTMVVALPDGYKADTVAAALVEHMATLPTHLRKSLTWDSAAGRWPATPPSPGRCRCRCFSATRTTPGSAARTKTL